MTHCEFCTSTQAEFWRGRYFLRQLTPVQQCDSPQDLFGRGGWISVAEMSALSPVVRTYSWDFPKPQKKQCVTPSPLTR